jgi:hypothetical protein
MRLPADRPLTSADALSALGLPRDPRRRAAWNAGCDAAWLLGLHPDAWRAVVHDACSATPCLLRPSQAILLRWLAAQSAPLLVCHDGAGPRDLCTALARAGRPVGLSNLAVALGFSAAAATRWADDASTPDAALRRICGALLAGSINANLIQRWRVWLDCARQESSLRGLGTELSSISDWHVTWAPIVPRGRGRPPRARSEYHRQVSLLVIETVTPAISRRRSRR